MRRRLHRGVRVATEEWLVRFGNSLKEYARVLADELKETHPEAEERALTFSFLTPGKFCPECWVRYGARCAKSDG
jgi:hypothetical protein